MKDDEGRILELLRAGDYDRAAESALRTYGPGVLAFLSRTAADPDTADDIFSVFSEDLWKGIRDFEGRSSVRGWAYRLAWHAACRYWKDPWQRRRRRAPSGALEEVVAEVRSQTSSHRLTENKIWLARVREALKPDDRALITLRLERNLPFEEIAAVLGAQHDTIRQRWKRLKEKLAKLAKERPATE